VCLKNIISNYLTGTVSARINYKATAETAVIKRRKTVNTKMRNLIAGCVVFCLCLTGVTSANLVDLAVNQSGTVTAATGQLTTFERYDPDPATGTGVFKPFLRVQGKGIEKGYNTDGTVEFETKPGKWTHSIKLGDVMVVNGQLEFLLDIDQSQGHDKKFLSLDVIKIFLADSKYLDNYAAGLGNLIYDLGDNWVKMDNTVFNPGNGTGDVRVLIPMDAGWSSDKYLYFYSQFGGNGGWSANSGFEEWATVVPEPATISLLGLSMLLVLVKKRRRA
jgi:hypothetical protein